MKIINGNKVFFSADDVQTFARAWPGCKLRDRAYWFEFDAGGDLIDTDVPSHDDGAEAVALADVAKQYLMEGLFPRWVTA